MSISTSADHFFQTSTSLAEGDRKQRKSSNILGDPVKLPSKVLAIALNTFVDSSGNTAILAEAGGITSAINISTNGISRLGRSAQAPITCLASYGGRQSLHDDSTTQCIFAGGWDKSITRFDLSQDKMSLSVTNQKSFKAHADFLKCLLVAQTPDKQVVLLSGSADGDINIWSFEGQRLASLKPQSRGIESIVLDPFSNAASPRIFFSTSQREIYSFILPAYSELGPGIKISDPVIQHETSVYKLQFDDDGDLWTASADKTAKRLVRENNFVADTTLAHPDFVRDIVIYAPAGLAVTACRDEEVRVWNIGTSQLIHVYSGHFEEVTGLALSGSTVLSISIDATLRRWSLAPHNLKEAIEEAKNPKLTAEEPEPKNDLGGLTEEEEAELRALMEEEETDLMDKMAADEQ